LVVNGWAPHTLKPGQHAPAMTSARNIIVTLDSAFLDT
jgi:hypothetical protein